MPTKQTGTARMDFRLSAQLKELIEHAATLSGQNLSDFATGVLTRHAEEVVERHRVIRISQQRYDEFAAFLDGPAAAIPAVSEALARRQRRRAGHAVRRDEPVEAAG